MTLAEFLLARIAEDEDMATAVRDYRRKREPFEREAEGGYQWDNSGMVYVSPARVLAECEAKRMIVNHLRSAIEDEARAQRTMRRLGPDNREAGEYELAANRTRQTVECIAGHLAEVYADHLDYDEAWRP